MLDSWWQPMVYCYYIIIVFKELNILFSEIIYYFLLFVQSLWAAHLLSYDLLVVKRSRKKVIFFSGPATKALGTPPSTLMTTFLGGFWIFLELQ